MPASRAPSMRSTCGAPSSTPRRRPEWRSTSTMLSLTADQAALVEEVRAFLDNEPEAPRFESLDDRFAYLVDYQRRLNQASLAVPAWPVHLGGRGVGPADAAGVSRPRGRA